MLDWVDVGTFGLLLVLATRNAVVYLAKQGKWRIFYLTLFYALTIAVALSRIVYFVSLYYSIKNPDLNPWAVATY